jgi:hypothetical protein
MSQRKRAQKKGRSLTQLETLLKQASLLPPEELKILIGGINTLLEASGDFLNDDEGDRSGRARDQIGSIELKYINGCGPYRYLRYWDGKIHRSLYLGKCEGLDIDLIVD